MPGRVSKRLFLRRDDERRRDGPSSSSMRARPNACYPTRWPRWLLLAATHAHAVVHYLLGSGSRQHICIRVVRTRPPLTPTPCFTRPHRVPRCCHCRPFLFPRPPARWVAAPSRCLAARQKAIRFPRRPPARQPASPPRCASTPASSPPLPLPPPPPPPPRLRPLCTRPPASATPLLYACPPTSTTIATMNGMSRFLSRRDKHNEKRAAKHAKSKVRPNSLASLSDLRPQSSPPCCAPPAPPSAHLLHRPRRLSAGIETLYHKLPFVLRASVQDSLLFIHHRTPCHPPPTPANSSDHLPLQSQASNAELDLYKIFTNEGPRPPASESNEKKVPSHAGSLAHGCLLNHPRSRCSSRACMVLAYPK